MNARYAPPSLERTDRDGLTGCLDSIANAATPDWLATALTTPVWMFDTAHARPRTRHWTAAARIGTRPFPPQTT